MGRVGSWVGRQHGLHEICSTWWLSRGGTAAWQDVGQQVMRAAALLQAAGVEQTGGGRACRWGRGAAGHEGHGAAHGLAGYWRQQQGLQ